MQRLFLSLAAVCLGCLAMPAIAHAQDDAGTYVLRGDKSMGQGNYDTAITNYSEALRIAKPDEIWVLEAYRCRGDAWAEKGEYDKAIADYNQALAIYANDGDAYFHRGNAWAEKGEFDNAIADYNQAVAINPNNARTYFYRGLVWMQKGESDNAIADFNQALAVNPNDADVYSLVAWIQATCADARYRNGPKAFENASKAYQLSGGTDWKKVDTLAAAYAENGDFSNARDCEEKAIELATADNDKAVARSHLEYYEQGKPYRDVEK